MALVQRFEKTPKRRDARLAYRLRPGRGWSVLLRGGTGGAPVAPEASRPTPTAFNSIAQGRGTPRTLGRRANQRDNPIGVALGAG